MSHIQHLENRLSARSDWARRRQLGTPNNKKLIVLACMDERLPVEEALGLEPGDAHVFRNAGGLVTDDFIRSAVLSTHLFGTREIIVVNHTDCGMLLATGDEVSAKIEEGAGIALEEAALDPALPGLKLSRPEIDLWWKTQKDIDEASHNQVELLRSHPLIPSHVTVTGYIYDVGTGLLRKPRAH